jgi:transcriptional regulator with XRE-family HTH domain
MKDITRRLRMLRVGVGLTQRDVAGRVGISMSRYWEIENGYRTPDDRELSKIARTLKAQPDDIVPSSEAVAR